MKKSVLLLFAISILASCRRCPDRDLDHYGFLPGMESYFDVYKNGSWWVYTNQENSKTDSIYISDFNEVIKKANLHECFDFPVREFNHHAKYFHADNVPGIINATYQNNGECCVNFINCGFFAKMDSTADTHPVVFDVLPQNLIDTISFNNVLYHDVICLDNDILKTYHAPGIGMIRFILPTDTFTLKSFYVN